MTYEYHQGKKYYYYGTYLTWKQAYNVARYYKRQDKAQYWIRAAQSGNLFPMTKYHLFLTKIIKL